jgi:Rrf2 family protein
VERAKTKSERSSLMNVGRRVDYAVRALSFLAGQPSGTIVSRADIEKSQDVPSFYLSKIMKDLVAGGLVQSHIGSKGGFTLAKKAAAITIKDIYETVERPLVLMECLERGRVTVLIALSARKNPFGKRRNRCLPTFSLA